MLISSAPHIPAARQYNDLVDWGMQPDMIDGQSQSSGRLLYKRDENGERAIESGLWVCTPGSWRLSMPGDEICYFLEGRAVYTEHNGDTIDVGPETVVHFPSGWSGRCDVTSTLRNTYMLARTPATIDREATPVMYKPLEISKLVDWGAVPTMIEGQSVTSGRLLYKGPGGRSETGIWVCTPGTWNCHVTSDEYCHFIAGRSTYTHESGELIEIKPDTVAFFPKDWRGVCQVHETVRKVYMIR
ncbi:MAG: cupin domain-containing protein [Dongiaceae bacterium]